MTPDDPRPPEPDPETPDAPGAATPHGPTTPGAPSAFGSARPAAHTPAGDVDELASALLDGDLDPDDTARQRPEVIARAAELEVARATVRDVAAADPTERERALAAALAAYDEQAPPASAMPLRPPPPAGGHGGVPAPAPVDLTAHRQARPKGPGARQGLPRWFGAAAAAVVVLAGLVGLAALTSGSDDADSAMDSASNEAQESTTDDAGAAAEDSAEAPPTAGSDESDSQRSAVEAGDLGMFPTADALVDHLRDSLGGPGDDTDIQPEASAPLDTDGDSADAFASCDGAPPPPLDDAGTTVVLHGRAVISDEAVNVWAIDTDRGRRVVAIDAACELVLDRPLR